MNSLTSRFGDVNFFLRLSHKTKLFKKMYFIENIISLPDCEALLEKAKIGRIRYSNRLGTSTIKSYTSTKNVSELATDREEWETNLATARSTMAANAPDSKLYLKAEVEAKEFDYRLSKSNLEETEEVGPDDVTESLFNKDLNEAIFEKYNGYIAALEARKVVLSQP